MTGAGGQEPARPEVRIVAGPDAGAEAAIGELRAVLARGDRPLVSFATGATFAPMLARLQREVEAGGIRTAAFLATHPDEYLGFAPDRPGGMVHELGERCPALREMLRAGAFLPVPHDGSEAALRAHAARLRRAGGVRLQFLGIGPNGHVAFVEPGTPFDRGFHVATLAASTRQAAASRFLPAAPPLHAVTAGIADLMVAVRCVLLAFGAGKAAAVRAALHGEVGPHCPASALRRHGNVLFVLDAAAASGLPGAACQ